MRCYNCDHEVNPTLLYCQNCGTPLDADEEDIQLDAEERAAERLAFEATRDAKGYLVLALFLFGAAVIARMVLLSDQYYEHYPAYRVPYTVVAEEGLEPPVAVELETLRIPLPGE